MYICSFVFLSVGPVGPRGGGIYSIIEDVVCQAYVLKTGLKPNNCGYMQFCLCRGPCRAQRWDIFKNVGRM